MTSINSEHDIQAIVQATTVIAEAVRKLEYANHRAETATPVEAAQHYFYMKQTYDELENARKGLYHLVDQLNKFIVPSLLDTAGTDKIRVPAVARSFYILKKYSASILDGKREDAYTWLREHDAGSLIQETVNAGTLTSYLKDLILEEGVDAPDDIFKFNSYNTTGMSKYTPK